MDITEDLLRRFAILETDRSQVESSWDTIEKYVTPYRGNFFTANDREGSVDWFQARDCFDSTAPQSHQTLAASIHGAVTNPGTRWFDMRFRLPELNEVKKAARWLEECSSQVYHALQDSNFNVKVNECYQDLAGMGTAFLVQEEKGSPGGAFGGMEFHAVPLKEAYFDPGHDGSVVRFFRLLRWTPTQIISKFGEEAVPDAVKDAHAKGSTEKLEVLYCIYPRNDKVVPIGERVYPSRRPWAYQYILRSTKDLLGKPGGFYEMPVFAPRWRLTAGSIWGNSPAHMAMADILSLNEAMKIHLVSAAKLMDPPMLTEESAIIGDLNLSPAALTVLRNIDGVKALQTGADLRASEITIARLQAAVRNYFFNDQISFPDPQAQPMTATEANIRYELMQRLLGPTLGRIQSEMLDPIVARTFRMLARGGMLPEPPIEVTENDAQFDIEYTGAMARAQRMDTAVNIERFLGTLMQFGQTPQGEGALDAVDFNQVPLQLGKALSVPAALLRDKTEVAKIQRERRNAAAREQEALIEQEEGAAQEAMNPNA